MKLPFSRLILLSSVVLIVSVSSIVIASDKWSGVDESVVEKYAEEHGRAARGPFINTDQGDLLLFLFLLAGAGGGFAAGYCWKELVDHRPQNPKVPGQRARTG